MSPNPLDFSLYGGAESLADGRRPPLNRSHCSRRPPRRTVVQRPPGNDLFQPPQDPNDFLWLMTEEPHRSRRMQILKTHPEVKEVHPYTSSSITLTRNTHFRKFQVTKLMGHEPLTKWIVLFVVTLQLVVAYALRSTNPHSPLFIFLAYAIGGTANHNLFLAIHEITHNLAFKGIKANKFLAMFANLPIAIPYAVTFKACNTSLTHYPLLLY